MDYSNLSVRAACEADMPSINEIFNNARAFMAAQGNPQWQDGFPDNNFLRAALAGGNLRVVCCGGRIAAVYSVFYDDADYNDIDGYWLTDNAKNSDTKTAEKYNFEGADLNPGVNSVQKGSDNKSLNNIITVQNKVSDLGVQTTECSYIAVHTVAVDSSFRGMGIAKFCLGSAEAECIKAGRGSIRMDTHVCNMPMQKLLSACGFVCCGKLKARGNGSFLCYEKLV